MKAAEGALGIGALDGDDTNKRTESGLVGGLSCAVEVGVEPTPGWNEQPGFVLHDVDVVDAAVELGEAGDSDNGPAGESER